MIKCNVTVSGLITRAAQMRNNKEGKPFITFGVSVVIPAKNGINKTVEISIAKDGEGEVITNYSANKRIDVTGTLIFHKKGDNLYWNMSASNINMSNPGSEDNITGTMEFRGTVGKQIDTKNDKKGNPYISFSAFSCEKDGENYAYTWVRFRQFGTGQPDWLQAKSHIEATGQVELSIYNDRIDMGCMIQELKPWDKKPYQPQN